MNILRKWFVFLAIVYSSFGVASQCPTNNVINNPNEFDWTYHPPQNGNPEYYSGTLEFGEATFNIGNEIITTRAYRQEGGEYSIPGPTFKMVPGNKYVVRYKNMLPYETKSTEHNVFKDPNVSNLHTHGLHISGESPGDDVTRFFEGGTGGDFVYDIPSDHMGGTYWYHAHHHGSTYLQVSGGAFGMIVVDNVFDNIPSHVAAMEEKQLILGFLDPGAAGTGGDTILGGSFSPDWTVNGEQNGNLCIQPNTWQHWRVLLADRDAKPKTVSVGSQCEVALMARDGVWRTEVPKNLSTNSLSLTGASRADIAVRCSNDSSISIGGQVVANVFVDGVEDTSVHPYANAQGGTWFSQRPSYLRDLRAENTVNRESVSMGARTINGSKFNHDVPTFAINTGDVQEWNIKGGQKHPFHLHIYHVQVQGDCGEYEDGEYYDVVAGNCTLRFDLNPQNSTVYRGRTVMHCHILDHEDQGAMGWLDVLGTDNDGSIGPPTFPVDNNFSYSDYYVLDNGGGGNPPAAPSGLNAVVNSSSQITLSWVDNSNDEDSFELEYSLDGITFLPLNSLGSNETSDVHTGLSASTTYYYRVYASNVNGDSAYSNVTNATTSSGSAATTVLVDTVNVATVGAGRGNKYGQATVIIRDDQGGLVSNAIVTGDFSGTFNETVSGATDSQGLIMLDTTNTAKGSVNLTFCVTGVTHTSLQDFVGNVCTSL